MWGFGEPHVSGGSGPANALSTALNTTATQSRPLIAVSIMALCVIFVARVAALTVGGLLNTKILVGAAVYSVSILALWLISGRRPGAESYLLDKAMHWRKR